MYNCILVPLDGSKRAERILPHVENLALSGKSKVILMQVVRVSVYSDMYIVDPVVSEDVFKKELQAAEIYLEGLQGEFREKRIETSVSVVTGPIVKAILDTAQKEKADLIAIASHGRSGIGRFFYGSVAAGVLNQIDRPLLIIRSQND